MAAIVTINLSFSVCTDVQSYSLAVRVPDSAWEARNRMISGHTGNHNSIVSDISGNGSKIDVTSASCSSDVDPGQFFSELCATAAGSATIKEAHVVSNRPA